MPETGRRIVVASWAANACFVVTAVPAAIGASAFDDAAALTALALFLVGLGVWVYAFAVSIARSTRENIAVANLFFLQGSAPKSVKVQLFGSLGVCAAAAAATATADPFGVLVPLLPLALVGLWAARHGTFPPRGQAAPVGRAPRSTAARSAVAERRARGRAGQ